MDFLSHLVTDFLHLWMFSLRPLSLDPISLKAPRVCLPESVCRELGLTFPPHTMGAGIARNSQHLRTKSTARRLVFLGTKGTRWIWWTQENIFF